MATQEADAPRPQRADRQVVNRLKSAEGHLRGVVRMVEEGQYCIDVLKQLQAIQGAIDSAATLILANHLSGCVTTAIRGEDPGERERVIGELLELFSRRETRVESRLAAGLLLEAQAAMAGKGTEGTEGDEGTEGSARVKSSPRLP